ncbi:putative aerobic respiration-related protein [Papiliotrema laurentii]|uniref:Aerobic respiration-related protein n=1 Tax=Papiliotrema laurentii TaxID=5418 RepID=A0AAD9FP23_PAPLA|nr:putative aerobic respiration-related protein [Papiliotrema laurentii]
MSVRAFRPLLRASASLRAAAPVSRALALRPAAALSRTFTSSLPRLGSGELDASLSSALQSEIAFEKEAADSQPAVPEFLQQFKEHGVWNLEDTPGSDSVSLTRKFGNETLKLTFQVSDLDEGSENAAEAELEQEDGSVESFDEPPFISCSLLLTKSATPGALLVDLECGDEGFIVTNVAMYEKAVAELQGPEGDFARRTKYMGPQFEHLDPDLQESFNGFLAERGVDESLSAFILQYCEHKEQKDYVSWLKELKGFVDA